MWNGERIEIRISELKAIGSIVCSSFFLQMMKWMPELWDHLSTAAVQAGNPWCSKPKRSCRYWWQLQRLWGARQGEYLVCKVADIGEIFTCSELGQSTIDTLSNSVTTERRGSFRKETFERQKLKISTCLHTHSE